MTRADNVGRHSAKYEREMEAEIARLRAALKDMIEISQRNSEATLMLIAIRKCAEHAISGGKSHEVGAD
jgi:hypothetical protein